MKYEILIEGGFTGIPKRYAGDIDLGEKTKESLYKAFDRKPSPESSTLRDGLLYHLKLVDGEKERDARFDETNLPLSIRQFIDTISKKNS